MPFFSVIAFIWTVIAYFDYSHLLDRASSAPQEAVAAAIGCASMMFPYFLIRIAQGQAQLTNQKEIITLLKAGAPQAAASEIDGDIKTTKKRGMYLWRRS